MAKKKQQPPTPTVAAKQDKKGKKGKNSEPEPEKKPAKNGRSIVAQSTSWTGKLPSSLLHEHCQKQKWNKVEYDMKKLPDGFLAVPILSWKNPKTQETINVKYHPPKDIVKPQETTLEARHYAATYALHRLAFNKNIHMVLPKNHKDLWSDLEVERKRITKDHPFRAKLEYTAEPFMAVLEKRKDDEKAKKEREVKEAAIQKEKKPTIIIGKKLVSSVKKPNDKPSRETTKSSNYNRNIVSTVTKTTFPKKVWNNTAMIDLDSELRTSIEKAIKNHIDWSEADADNSASSVSYASKLEELGFRKVHVDEALKYTYTFNDTLEWLIFHLPEDDLPETFARDEKDSGTSLKVMKDISKERLIKKLMRGGFSRVESKAALETNDYDLVRSAVYLTNKLTVVPAMDESTRDEIEIASLEEWIQEKESLKAIYESKIQDDDPPKDDIYEISLSPEGLDKDLLSLVVYRSNQYPYDICGLLLVVKNDSYRLPNYIKVSLIFHLTNYIVDSGLLGIPYIYSCVDWLEQNLIKIIQNPGPLYNPLHGRKKNLESASASSSYLKSSNNRARSKKKLDITAIELAYEKKQGSSALGVAIKSRSKLPAWKKKQDLVDMINNNKVCLVTGETGSGKSTQIVQFILDDLNSKKDFSTTIVCTQPRRISTIGLADRISAERVDKCGDETGYIIRGENKTNSKTRISFVTTGVLLRMIQSIFGNKNEHDTFFDNLGYIFIDEVHERSIDSDFLLMILKQIAYKFPKLKIVLMSATIDISIFQGYFGESEIAHVHISGRTFPIEDYYLDSILKDLDYTFTKNDEIVKPSPDSKFFQEGNINYDLIANLVDYCDKKLSDENNAGSILIFLPGVLEIKKCLQAINSIDPLAFWALPLHSALSSQDQKKIFNSPPSGKRKIVCSTNIAETSITIPDAVVVIDTGRSKSVQYDHKSNTTKLIESWASQAEVGQRRGRAGRVQSGLCYKLYTKSTENAMLAQAVPEIKRTKLESIYLVVKSMGIKDVYTFLKHGLDPPGKENVENAKRILTEIGALHNDDMTHLGSYLSLLPTDLNSGKLLIFGVIFGCLEACLTLAAISVSGSPFIQVHEQRDEIKAIQQKFSQGHGDLIAILNAYNEYTLLSTRSSKNSFLQNNHCSHLRMTDINSTRTQYLTTLQSIGLIPIDYVITDPYYNRNNNNFQILRSLVSSSSYPNIARVELPDTKYLQTIAGSVELDPDARKVKYWIRNEAYTNNTDCDQLPSKRAFIHPGSTMFDIQSYPSFVSFGSAQETAKLYLRDVTPNSILSVLLFGGAISYDISSKSRGVIMDDWLPIRTWCKNAVLLLKLRLLLDQTIKARLENPGANVGDDVLIIVERMIKGNI